MTAPAAVVAAQLRQAFRARGRVLVAFSGGVDSAVLAKIGADALGDDSLAVIVDSESYAREEKEHAEAFARKLGIPHETVFHSELADERYAANPVNRCYFCRQGLSDVLLQIASERGYPEVAVGTNADDAQDENRPGDKALRERGAWQPFVEMGLTKQDVRALAKHLDLPVWDKPSMACLSSRIPYGERVTLIKLDRIGRAESWLREKGFRQVRVRTHEGTRARIEVLPEEIARLRDMLPDVREALLPMGYAHVEVDPAGYRTGALNEPRT